MKNTKIKKIRTNTGFKGVSKRNRGGYQAQFYNNGNKTTIGTYNKLKDAVNARTEYIESLVS